MRRLLLFLPLLLAGCYPYYPYYGSYYGSYYGYPNPYAQAYPPGYYGNRPPPPGYGGPPLYRNGPPPVAPSGGQAYNTENCGTPDEPKACPPMPRVPLPYYPANRQ